MGFFFPLKKALAIRVQKDDKHFKKSGEGGIVLSMKIQLQNSHTYYDYNYIKTVCAHGQGLRGKVESYVVRQSDDSSSLPVISVHSIYLKAESIYLSIQRVSSGSACCCRCPGCSGPRPGSVHAPS